MSGFEPKMIDAVPNSARRWRRVVTGERAGRSAIVTDNTECPFRMAVEGAEGIVVTEMWRTGRDPECAPNGPETCTMPLAFGPVAGGTVALILEWAPDAQLFGTTDPSVANAATTHATDTIDYLHVIDGEIHVMLEEGESCLRTGDTLVQRGTSHGWSNRSAKPCRMFVVMVSAKS